MIKCPFDKSEMKTDCGKYFNPYIEWGIMCRKCQIDNPFKAEYFHMPEIYPQSSKRRAMK